MRWVWWTSWSASSGRHFREIVYRGSYMSTFEMTRYAQNLEGNLRGREYSIEGPLAFAEKRVPVFKNR
jgi:hypothetical protein